MLTDHKSPFTTQQHPPPTSVQAQTPYALSLNSDASFDATLETADASFVLHTVVPSALVLEMTGIASEVSEHQTISGTDASTSANACINNQDSIL